MYYTFLRRKKQFEDRSGKRNTDNDCREKDGKPYYERNSIRYDCLFPTVFTGIFRLYVSCRRSYCYDDINEYLSDRILLEQSHL